MAFIAELIAANDEQSISACLGGPAYLAGITQQAREALTHQWNVKRQPALAGKLALLQATQERLERAGANFLSTCERGMGCDYRLIKRLRDAAAAAKF